MDEKRMAGKLRKIRREIFRNLDEAKRSKEDRITDEDWIEASYYRGLVTVNLRSLSQIEGLMVEFQISFEEPAEGGTDEEA